MKKLGLSLHLIKKLARRTALGSATLASAGTFLTGGALLATAVTVTACADENDPKTWAKRLDDPTQKGTAIRRFSDFFNDRMTKTDNKLDAPEMQELLNVMVEPLTKTYTAGGLDEKTRKDLIKLLADTKDPRAQAAFAKALSDYEPGKTDDDVKFAAQGINGLAKVGKLDGSVADVLWNTFSKFRVSKATSIKLIQELHDAVLAVKSPSYGPKAIEKLNAPVSDDVDSRRDHLEFWQLTSVQVIGELRYGPGVKTLVQVLLTPSKLALNATARTAMLKMPKETEPVLIAALKGSDPEIAKLGKDFEDKANIAIVADVLGLISRPLGRDAVLNELPNADTDTMRFGLAQSLVQFPADRRSVPAFMAAYGKITGGKVKVTELPPRAALGQVAGNFYDSSLTEWLVKESLGAKGPEAKLLPLDSAMKLMTAGQKHAVQDALAKAEPELPKDAAKATKQMFQYASEVADKCREDVGCFVKVLDEPIPSTPATANMRAIKAAWMSAIYGQAKAGSTREELLKRVDKVKDMSARLALVQAIDRLAPEGDPKAAEALDAVVEADKKTGDKLVLMGDDAVVKVANRLRARAVK